jgi:organic hydroperoxide reductase OsmC/OhrA
VSVNGLNGHGNHPGDLIPAPASGCPTSALAIDHGKITICHATGSQTNPYNKITVSVNGLNGHSSHPDDLIPAPAGGCPASPAVISNGKITICHATGSKTNPYVEITVSVNGLNGHVNHPNDLIPAPAGGCPTAKP